MKYILKRGYFLNTPLVLRFNHITDTRVKHAFHLLYLNHNDAIDRRGFSKKKITTKKKKKKKKTTTKKKKQTKKYKRQDLGKINFIHLICGYAIFEAGAF